MNSKTYEGATPEQLRHPLVRELLGVHNMFRDQLTAILQFVDELIAGEQQLTAQEIAAHTRTLIQAGSRYTQMLHMHHHLETSMMFPKLEEQGLESAVIERLNRDHDEIGALIDQFSAAIQHLSTIEPDVMNTDLRRLSEALQAHLAYEETHVCPRLTRFSHWPMSH